MQWQSSFRIGRDCEALWITFNQDSYGRIMTITNCIICWVVWFILACRFNTHHWSNVHHLLNRVTVYQRSAFQYVMDGKIAIVIHVVDSFWTVNEKQSKAFSLQYWHAMVSSVSLSPFEICKDSEY